MIRKTMYKSQRVYPLFFVASPCVSIDLNTQLIPPPTPPPHKVRIAKPGGKKGAGGEQRVVIGRLSRNRRKFVTVVGGLDTFPGKCKIRFLVLS